MKKLAGTVFFMICLGCVPVENRPPIDLVAARGMTPGTTTSHVIDIDSFFFLYYAMGSTGLRNPSI